MESQTNGSIRLKFKAIYLRIFLLNRILYVSPFAFSASGADESLFSIVSHIPMDRFSVHVLTPPASPYIDRYRKAGAIIHTTPMMRLKRSYNPIYWLLWLLWTPVETLLILRLIKKIKPSLIHVNMESTLASAFAAKILQIPLVYHYRGNANSNPKWFF